MRHRVQFPASPLNMAKLDITAIVPCYNEEKTIGSVLNALKTSPELRKVIVVDDCSTDGSKEVIRKFDVQLISNIKNLGKGGSVKKALQLVKKKYVMMCDADLRWLHKDSITALLKPLADNTDVMAVGLRDHDWHRQKPGGSRRRAGCLVFEGYLERTGFRPLPREPEARSPPAGGPRARWRRPGRRGSRARSPSRLRLRRQFPSSCRFSGNGSPWVGTGTLAFAFRLPCGWRESERERLHHRTGIGTLATACRKQLQGRLSSLKGRG